jgi:hypothetical protein
VRECPQCLQITWAYNKHCHHCGLDIQLLERRQLWRRLRQLIGYGVAACLVALLMVLQGR